MKIVVAGAGHWHLPLYIDPLNPDPDIRVVGVTDRRRDVAEAIAAQHGCAAGTDLSGMLEQQAPDAVLVLGRHCDMAGHAHRLIETRTPFIIEKPAGTTLAEVSALAAAARQAGVFAAVPFVIRSTGFMTIVRDLLQDDPPVHAAFKFIGGLPGRYRENGNDWMLDRRLAGGGVLTNLGVHFLDLMNVIFGTAQPRLISATFANHSGEGDVEDFADACFRFGSGLGRVETGYLFPAPTGQFDMHYSVRTARHYVTATGPGAVTVTDLAGHQVHHAVSTTNMEIYPTYMRDTLNLLRDGKPPVAGLDDLERAMRMVDTAYAKGHCTAL